jgi:hypothetical protein
MRIVVQYAPTDRSLLAGLRVVRFAADTQHQVEPYCEALPEGTVALVCDTEAPEPMDAFRRFSAQILTDMHNALRGDEPAVGLPRIHPDGLRRLYNRIVQRAREAEPEVFNPAPALTDQAAHEAEMIVKADHFVVSAFRGNPKGFDRHIAKTLEEARKIAVSLNWDRPCGIYAVRGNRQTHVENYPPTADFHAKPKEQGSMDDENQPQPEPTAGQQPEPTAKKTGRPYTLGEFKPLRPSSAMGKIARAIEDGCSSIDGVSAQLGMDRDEIVGHLRSARRTHGIDHTLAEDGALALIVPLGQAVFKEAAAAAEPKQQSNGEAKPRAPRIDKALEVAKQGIMPQVPDFSANTHKPWRKKLDQVIAMVNEHDLDGLRAFTVNAVSTSPRAILRYRDCALAALEARA